MSLLMRRRMMAMEDDEVKEWEQVANIDLSQFASARTEIIKCSIQASEIFCLWEDVENGTSTASTINLFLNGNITNNIPVSRSGKSGSPLSGYTMIKLIKGIGVIFEISGGSDSKTNYAYTGSLNVPFNLIPIVDEFTEMRIVQPPTQYFATSGNLKVFVR